MSGGPAGKSPRFLSWRSDGDGGRTWSGAQWGAYTGQDERAGLAMGWLDAVHPEDAPRVRAAWGTAAATGLLAVDHRIRSAAGGYAWFRSGAAPAGSPGDAAAGWLGSSVAIEDLKAALTQQEEVLAALQHRVRNTLGTVRSVARLSLHDDATASDYAAALDARIAAMARIQAELIRNPLAGTNLAQLIADELMTLAEQEGRRVSIAGPDVRLRGRAAETLGLALHELATNAVRHGALTADHGRIDITWQFAGHGEAACLDIRWRETGLGDPPLPPVRRGFGMNMLESVLPYQLRATVALRFEPGGLQAGIELPLAGNVMPAATA